MPLMYLCVAVNLCAFFGGGEGLPSLTHTYSPRSINLLDSTFLGLETLRGCAPLPVRMVANGPTGKPQRHAVSDEPQTMAFL